MYENNHIALQLCKDILCLLKNILKQFINVGTAVHNQVEAYEVIR